MQVIQIITLMFSTASCLFIFYAVGLYDSYKRDLRNTSKYIDAFVQQLAERHNNEIELIAALKKIADREERSK